MFSANASPKVRRSSHTLQTYMYGPFHLSAHVDAYMVVVVVLVLVIQSEVAGEDIMSSPGGLLMEGRRRKAWYSESLQAHASTFT